MVQKFSFAILLLSVSTIPQEVSAAEGKEIGSLYECAHQLSGKVIIKNEREIIIKGFHYDGAGPAAWFHGQLKGAKGVGTSNNNYKTLSYPNANCDRLTVGRSYRNEDITLILPVSIKELETIGVFCYQFCHNFGHIVIPKDLDVPPAPDNLMKVTECPKPDHKPCSDSAIKPNCRGGEIALEAGLQVGNQAGLQVGNHSSGANINQQKSARSVPILGIIAVLGFFLGRPNFH